MFNPGGSTGHLRACPFLGTWRALLCRKFSFGRRLVAIWNLFGKRRSRKTIFKGGQAIRTYCCRLLFSLEVRLIREVRQVRRHAVMVAGGMNGCQGTPWNEEVDGKELLGAFGGECYLKPRGSPVSCISSTGVNPHFNIYYKCGIMLVLGVGVSCVFFLLPDSLSANYCA